MKIILKFTIIMLIFLFFICGTTSVSNLAVGEYDPWCDIDDDGDIDIFDVVNVAGSYGTSGEPFEAKAAIEYDSGWINITDKCGQNFDITHNLNNSDVIVDITGKTTGEGGVHQRNFGGISFTQGWSKMYGGEGEFGWGVSLIQTSDGGFAIAGCAFYGSWDFWFGKFDRHGEMEWSRTLGGVGDDKPYSIVQTSDGGYAIGGYTNSYGAGGYDFWLVKTSSHGSLEWNFTYGGANDDRAYSVVQTSDGGYAIGGYTNSYGAGGTDFWLVKTDQDGEKEWSASYGGTDNDIGYSLVQTNDGGYAIGGYVIEPPFSNQSLWLVKTNSTGDAQWNKTMIQRQNYDLWTNQAPAMIQTDDGGFLLGGAIETGMMAHVSYLVKTDINGNVQWNRTYGGMVQYMSISSVIQTWDGGYIMAGWKSSTSVLWLEKMDSEVGMVWIDSTADTISLCRGTTDPYWNFVRVRIWKIKDS